MRSLFVKGQQQQKITFLSQTYSCSIKSINTLDQAHTNKIYLLYTYERCKASSPPCRYLFWLLLSQICPFFGCPNNNSITHQGNGMYSRRKKRLLQYWIPFILRKATHKWRYWTNNNSRNVSHGARKKHRQDTNKMVQTTPFHCYVARAHTKRERIKNIIEFASESDRSSKKEPKNTYTHADTLKH